jgi:hypothetical protein
MTEMKGKFLPEQSWFDLVHSTRKPVEDEVNQNPVASQHKIEDLLKFFQKNKIRYDDIDPEEDFLKNLKHEDAYEKKKKAYPNNEVYRNIPGERDQSKWLQTVKEIYYKEKDGIDRIAAIKQATNNWNVNETYDFLNWLKFYESGSHMKYKMAQSWYENGAPGYFLHIKPDAKKEETNINGNDVDKAHDAISNELPANERKRIIEKQRSKIIGRLDSAEKLLRTHEGQIFAGREFESLLETIYQLKKKVQLVNKISTSTRLYEDMIIREANIMNKKGFVKAANLLFSISQANNPPPDGTGTPGTAPAITPPSPAPPAQSSGAVGGLPSMGPGMPQTPPESAPNENPVPKGIAEFLQNLDPAKKEKDKSLSDDVLEVSDTLDVNDSESEILVTEAQEVPAPSQPAPPKSKAPPKPKAPLGIETESPLEVTDNVAEINQDRVAPQVRDFDRMIDSAFANLKVSDVVAKLEDLAKIFKTREIPRQLSIVDMMLDSLGLAAYFPSLSEATNKALESNNYISTRVDDILAKLHGSIATNEVDLRGESKPLSSSPEIDSLKNKLRQEEDKDKARKKLRKDQANQELMDAAQPKETPDIEIEEDLSKPTAEEAAPPVPKPAPVAPPRPVTR